MRQKDQTKKAPTGTFQRDNLLAHLEKQAKEDPDKEDLVPFTGEKRGKNQNQNQVPCVWRDSYLSMSGRVFFFSFPDG